MAQPILVSSGKESGDNSNEDFPKGNQHDASTGTERKAQLMEKTDTTSDTDLNRFENSALSETARKILDSRIRKSTRDKYTVYWKQFKRFCVKFNKKPQEMEVDSIVNFFAELYDREKSFSVINTAKLAISHHLSFPPYKHLSEHPLVDNFFKGLFNLKPPKPKLSFTWDVNRMFTHFNSLETNDKLSDKDLSQKLCMLLLLIGGQRVNTIYNFTVDRMIMTDVAVSFAPGQVLKHSRKGKKLDTFIYRAYNANKKLCVLDCLTEYMRRRTPRVDKSCNSLLITYGKPFRMASADTIRRWIKDLFTTCKIYDFSAHSCRSASTSKAALIMDIEDVIKKGCWKNARTFLEFYDKEIIVEKEIDFNVMIDLNNS